MQHGLDTEGAAGPICLCRLPDETLIGSIDIIDEEGIQPPGQSVGRGRMPRQGIDQIQTVLTTLRRRSRRNRA